MKTDFKILFFDWKLFLFLSFSFILLVPIGTLSHEFGHYFSARILGYDAFIHYNRTSIDGDESEINSLLIRSAGPLQTILTGAVGFIILWRKSEKLKSSSSLSHMEWLTVFLCFFWSRQVLNPIVYTLNKLYGFTPELTGDENYLSLKLNLPELSISVSAGIICLSLLSFVVFKLVPKTQRLSFLLAGITGSALGFIFWFSFIGKVIMP